MSIMCLIKDIGRFMFNGLDTFKKSSRGEYRSRSKDIARMRKDFLNKKITKADDRYNLLKDRTSIEKDIRISFNKIVLSDGETGN